MKFYLSFLERMSGKENFEKATFKVPQLLDMMVSPVVPLASLTFSGRLIIFPEFEMYVVPKSPPRDPRKRNVAVACAKLSLLACSTLTPNEASQLQERKEMEDKVKSWLRQLPPIPEHSSGKKQPAASTPKGKAKLEGQASKQSRAQAAKSRSCRGGGQGEHKVPFGSKLPSLSSETRLPEEATYKVFVPQPPGPETVELLRSRPEMFWSVLQEPQKTILAGYSFDPSLLVPPIYERSRSAQGQPPKTTPVVSRMEWPWLE
ncbi:uncharacterized protein LOC142599665 isoform X2 [Balearica regulorum gibbericeps]